MGRFGYKIKENNGRYHFELYPGNSHTFPIGQSKEYENLTECLTAISDFRSFVSDNGLDEETSGKVQIDFDNTHPVNSYYFKYIINDEVVFFRHGGYGNRRNCINGIKSIYHHIDEYTTHDLDWQTEGGM